MRPEGFDARDYMNHNLPFVQSGFQIDVWIEMPVEEARQSFTHWRVSMKPEENGVRVRCSRDNLEIFAAMLLTLTHRIVVHGPEELRETFRRLARRGAAAARSIALESQE